MRKTEWSLWLIFWTIIVFSVIKQSEAGELNTEIKDVLKETNMSSISCHIYNVYHEARSGSDLEMIAVMNTVSNRVKSPHFPNSICEVIKQKWAYSWTNDKRSDVMYDKESVERISSVVDKYLLNKGLFISLSEGIDHYHHISITPEWSQSKRMKRVGIVGEHIFYRRK